MINRTWDFVFHLTMVAFFLANPNLELLTKNCFSLNYEWSTYGGGLFRLVVWIGLNDWIRLIASGLRLCVPSSRFRYWPVESMFCKDENLFCLFWGFVPASKKVFAVWRNWSWIDLSSDQFQSSPFNITTALKLNKNCQFSHLKPLFVMWVP